MASAAAGQPPPVLKDPNTNGDTACPDAPGDGISCLAWSPAQNLLAAGSWDTTVRVWDVGGQAQEVASRLAYQHTAPVLCCGFSRDGRQLVSGGCDHKVKVRDLQAQQDKELGSHDAPVKELAVADDLGLVISGSWDKTLRVWSPQQAAPVATVPLPERVYAMDYNSRSLVVGTADRHVLVFNFQDILQNPAIKPEEQCFSQLKMQTRSLGWFPDRSGYALGSVEGRCWISYRSDSSRSFTFKCHRLADSLGSVNAIHFNPRHGTFATAGSDGNFVFWDKEKKQRLKQFNSCYYPITACKFNVTGDLFAYAVSYDWSQGHEAYHPSLPNQVLIHKCEESEVAPRR